jgi:hypothetical protein
VPGVIAGVLVAVAAFAAGRIAVTGLGLVTAATAVSHYYSLDAPLLVKALSLLAAGAVLLAARYAFRYWIDPLERRCAMRKGIVVLAGIALLVVVNASILSRERLIEEGRVVLLELTPSIRARSCRAITGAAVQVARDAQSAAAIATTDGWCSRRIRAVSPRFAVSTTGRRSRGRGPDPLSRSAQRAQARDQRVVLRGRHGRDYASARFGELRVAPEGERSDGAARPGARSLGRPAAALTARRTGKGGGDGGSDRALGGDADRRRRDRRWRRRVARGIVGAFAGF